MKNVVILIMFLALTSAFSFAAQVTVDDVLEGMKKADEKAESVKFDFSQEVNYTLTKEKIVSSGNVSFSKPDNLHFLQKEPIEQTVVSNGTKVWVYTPAYEQVVVDTWKRWLNSGFVPSTLVNFSSNWQKFKENYNFEYLGEDEGLYLLLLTPVEKDGSQKALEGWEMKLWVNVKTFIPVKTSLKSENVSIITKTKNYKLNPKLDKDLFNFKVPDGIEVMHMP